jgi:hypothetical protein
VFAVDRRYYSNGLGVEVCFATKGRSVTSLFLDFMPDKVTPTDEIIELYKVKRRPVRKVAGHVGITTQSVYARLRKAGVTLESELRSDFKRLDRSKLLEAYESSLSGPEVAKKLGVSKQTLKRELDHYKIRRRKGHPSRRKVPDPSKNSKIGESVEITKVNGKFPSLGYIYRRAKRTGILVTIKRVSDDLYKLTRLK